MKRITAALVLLIWSTVCALAGSTVNPSVPAANSQLNSSVVRNNFLATYTDINNILGVFAGSAPPANPTNLQSWADTTTSPNYVLKYWNGQNSVWIPYAIININTNTYTPFFTSGGFLATAPITASVSGGVVTYGLNKNANFATVGGNLAFANISAGNMLANCTNAAAEPTSCTWNSYANQAIGNINGSIPSRVGGTWTTVSTGTSGHVIPFLDTLNIFSAKQTIYAGSSTLRPEVGYTPQVRGAALDGNLAAMQLDSFNSLGVFMCLRSDGTAAVSLPLAANDTICSFSAHGYDGVTDAQGAYMRMYAAQAWNSTSHGSYIRFGTVANNTTTTTDRVGIENDGGVTIPPSVTGGSRGNGTINISGGFWASAMNLYGSVSGVASISAPPTVGSTPTFQLPVGPGLPSYVLQTDGAGHTFWGVGTVITPEMYGAKGDGINDDAPAFRAAILAMPQGGQLVALAKQYYMNSCMNNGVLDFTPASIRNNGITISGQGYSWSPVGGYGAGNPPGGTVFLLGPAIPSTCDFIHRAGTTNVVGFNLRGFLVRPYIGAGGFLGRHMIHFDASGSDSYTEQYGTIENVFLTDNLTNTGYAIKATANSTNVQGVLNQYTIQNSTLMSGVNLINVGDTVRVLNNGVGANSLPGSIGITVVQTVATGTAGLVVSGNNVVNVAGRIVIGPAIAPIVSNNYVEANTSSGNSVGIDFVGSVYWPTVTNNLVTNNSVADTHIGVRFGAGVVGGILDGNTITVPAGSTAASILSGANSVKVGVNNYYVGGNLVTNSVTDAGTLSRYSPLATKYPFNANSMPFTDSTGALSSSAGIAFDSVNFLMSTSYFNAVTGYRFNGGTGTAGQVLRSNGTAGFVPASLAAADLSNGVSGTGAVALVGSPTFTGTAGFAALSASGQISSSVTTGTAPLVVASTTNVANLNASSLNGTTFSAPGAIGGGTAAAGTFTTLTASTYVGIPTATSAVLGLSRCDNTTISCPGGVFTAVGASATAITVGTTLVGSGTDKMVLYNNAGALGNQYVVVTIKRQTFCTSGCTTTVTAGGTATYTPSVGLIKTKVFAIGSGGAGGGAISTGGEGYGGSGGGSGQPVESLLTAATIGASQTVAIGAAGVGVSNGNGTDGAAVSLGTLVVANGGKGGSKMASGFIGSSGLGGSGGTGDTKGTGAPGGAGWYDIASSGRATSGMGGSSTLGGGGPGVVAVSGQTVAGNAGSGYGSAGGGGVSVATSVGAAGGAGKEGILIIEEYVNQP